MTAKEALDMWRADLERVRILDVRTPEEWVFVGHAPMAVNVPVAFMAYVWDDKKHGYPWELNPEEGSKVDDPDSVFFGMRLKNGWKASGLPWTYDLDPERMTLPARTTGPLHVGNAED